MQECHSGGDAKRKALSSIIEAMQALVSDSDPGVALMLAELVVAMASAGMFCSGQTLRQFLIGLQVRASS